MGEKLKLLKSLTKKVDRLLAVAEVDDWENEQAFIERTGFKTPDQRLRYRKANPLAWKKGNTGHYIYSKSKWLESHKDIKEQTH